MIEPIQKAPFVLPSMPPSIPQVESAVDFVYAVNPRFEEYRYEHTHTIVLLHGSEQSAAEFANDFFDTIYDHLDKCVTELYSSFKWVFPSAKQLHMALPPEAPGESSVSRWFDMQTTRDPRKGRSDQGAEFDASISYIKSIIQTEAAILGDMDHEYHRIVLGGFDQGCAVAMQALTHRTTSRLAGFIGLNGWMQLPSPSHSIDDDNDVLETFVHTSHNKNDRFIDINYGREVRNAFEGRMKQHYNYYDEYEQGGHWINEAEVHRLMFFIYLCTYCEDREILEMGFENCRKCDDWWEINEVHSRVGCVKWFRPPRQHG